MSDLIISSIVYSSCERNVLSSIVRHSCEFVDSVFLLNLKVTVTKHSF